MELVIGSWGEVFEVPVGGLVDARLDWAHAVRNAGDETG